MPPRASRRSSVGSSSTTFSWRPALTSRVREEPRRQRDDTDPELSGKIVDFEWYPRERPPKWVAVIEDDEHDLTPVGVAELPAMVAASEQPRGIRVEYDVAADGALAPGERVVSKRAVDELASEPLDDGEEDDSSDDDSDDEGAAVASVAPDSGASAAARAAAGTSAATGGGSRSSEKKRRRDTRGDG